MGTQVSEVKKILRQQMREAMAEMTEQEKAWSDRELVSAFLAHPKLDEANTVMLYYGVGQEIATADLIQTLLDQGKTVCLPKCLPEHQMEARIIQSLDELEPDAYGIPAPKDACPVLEREKIDLILVPGLCFDSKGNRLGQGGGYYDRYLEDFDGNTIGLCREDFFQINLPREPLDAFVRVVLTEEGQVWPMTQPLDCPQDAHNAPRLRNGPGSPGGTIWNETPEDGGGSRTAIPPVGERTNAPRSPAR